MGLAERRRALGYSQEAFAHLLGVDRTTVGRWESRRIRPQPAQRRKLAAALETSLQELDALLAPRQIADGEPVGSRTSEPPNAGDPDEMIRREFLRILTVSGALATLPADEAEALAQGVRGGVPADFSRMNSHLWQVYQSSRSKGSVYPVVRDQLGILIDALTEYRGSPRARALLNAAADLFQLAGEVAFDGNRYSDAAASYALAASVSKDAQAYDLWACALVRHAYVDMSELRYRPATQLLDAAEHLACRGTRASRHANGSHRCSPRPMPLSVTWTRVSGRWTALRLFVTSTRTASTGVAPIRRCTVGRGTGVTLPTARAPGPG